MTIVAVECKRMQFNDDAEFYREEHVGEKALIQSRGSTKGHC